MRLYKFKSLADFEFVADIIMRNRLYAADFRSLNDPMEGLFHNYGSKKSIIDSINAAKQKHLVCSLSKDCTSPLLWAHYADGFKGVCIEVEVNENILTPYIVEYTKESPVVSYDRSDKLMGEPKPDPSELAVEALTRKFPDWEYEKEVRILKNSDSSYVDNGINVVSVIFGVDTNQIYQDIIKKITPKGVQLFQSALNISNKVMRMPLS